MKFSDASRAKLRAAALRLWANPEYRARAVAGTRASRRTPEARRAQAERTRRVWRDPVIRERYVAAIRKSAPRRGRKIVWFAEMDRTLVEMRSAGATITECADAIGVGVPACSRRIRELGLARRVTSRRIVRHE